VCVCVHVCTHVLVSTCEKLHVFVRVHVRVCMLYAFVPAWLVFVIEKQKT